MAQPRIPFEAPNSNPNWVFGNNGPTVAPGGRDMVYRPNHIFGGGEAPPRGPHVTDAEFRNAKPIGPTGPEMIKDVTPQNGKYYDAARNAGAKVGDAARTIVNNPLVEKAGKVLSAVDAANQGLKAVDSFQGGDNIAGGYHALRSGVAIGAAHGNPLSMAAAGGLTAGDILYNHGLSDDTKGSIGSGLNRLVRGAGNLVGQDWGVDPAKGDAATFGGASVDGVKDYVPPKFKDVNPTTPVNHRGQGFDDPRRIDRDPSRQSLGASRDFTNELASLPANLPADLRQGVIHKTVDANGRTVYSGMNVGNDAQIVDGMGRPVTPRGSFQVASGGVTFGPNGSYAFTPSTGGLTPQALAQRQAQTTAALTNPDGSRWTAQDNAIMAANLRDGIDPYRGTSRGAAQAAPQGGGGGVGGQMYTPADIASRMNDLTSPERIALRNLSLSTAQKSGETPQAHTTRMAGVQKQAETILGGYADVNKQTTDRLNSQNQLRGTMYTADQNLRGHEMTARAAMYGHDISAANHRATALADMRRQQIEQMRWERGDDRATRAEGDKRVSDLAKHYATGPDGKVDPLRENEFMNGAQSLLGNAIAAAEKRGDTTTAARLRKEGLGSLDSQDIQQHVARLRAKAVSRDAHGIAPWSGNHIESSPEGYDIVGKTPGILWDTAHFANGGSAPSFRLTRDSLNPLNPTTTAYDSIGGRKLRQE